MKPSSDMTPTPPPRDADSVMVPLTTIADEMDGMIRSHGDYPHAYQWMREVVAWRDKLLALAAAPSPAPAEDEEDRLRYGLRRFHDGYVQGQRDATPPAPDALLAEVARLTECLARANAGMEDYERRYYLAKDAAESDALRLAREAVAAMDAELANNRHSGAATFAEGEASRACIAFVRAQSGAAAVQGEAVAESAAELLREIANCDELACWGKGLHYYERLHALANELDRTTATPLAKSDGRGAVDHNGPPECEDCQRAPCVCWTGGAE